LWQYLISCVKIIGYNSLITSHHTVDTDLLQNMAST
jgi:hypothetical protein